MKINERMINILLLGNIENVLNWEMAHKSQKHIHLSYVVYLLTSESSYVCS